MIDEELPPWPSLGAFVHPGFARSHQRDDRGIGQPYSRGKDRTAHDDSPMIDQHHVAGLTKADRLGGRRKEFLGVDHPMDDADRLIAETVHDGETDGKGIGAGQLVEINVLDIELADAPVVASLSTRRNYSLSKCGLSVNAATTCPWVSVTNSILVAPRTTCGISSSGSLRAPV